MSTKVECLKEIIFIVEEPDGRVANLTKYENGAYTVKGVRILSNSNVMEKAAHRSHLHKELKN